MTSVNSVSTYISTFCVVQYLPLSSFMQQIEAILEKVNISLKW